MRVIIKYHDRFEKAFRLAREQVTEATRRAIVPIMNDLLTYVRTEKLQGNPLYSRTSELADSISVETRVSGQDVYGIMGTDLGWIDVHERGAIIYPRTAPYLRFPLYKRGTGTFLGWRVADSVTIPKRPVIGSTVKEKQAWMQRTFEELFTRRVKWFMAKQGGLHIR